MKIFKMDNNLSRFRLSDNVPLDTTPIYEPLTVYGIYNATTDTGAVQYNGSIYKSVADANLGNQPDVSPLKWLLVGPTNETAYLDTLSSNQSVNTSTVDSMTFEYSVSGADMIFLSGLVGTDVTIKLTDSVDTSIVYLNETVHLALVTDAMDWGLWSLPSMDETVYLTKVYRKIEKRYNQTLTVTITPDVARGGTALGILAFSSLIDVGCTKTASITRDVKSNSKVERDSNGVLQVIESRGYTRLTVPVHMGTTMVEIDKVQRQLEKFMDSAIGVFADDTGESYSMSIYGIYRDIQTSISYLGDYEMTIDSLETI